MASRPSTAGHLPVRVCPDQDHLCLTLDKREGTCPWQWLRRNAWVAIALAMSSMNLFPVSLMWCGIVTTRVVMLVLERNRENKVLC
jgi:hypothetical protein